ncbi:MAG: hypothetical protein GVY27_00165 [Deinococcus-Thermus bacterium]|jgi:hypothetical protein|nr:hypothetical protein [Deinococcota bacterium]
MLLVRLALSCALAAPAHAQLLERSPIDRLERPIGFADRRDVVRPIAGRRDAARNRVVSRGSAAAAAVGNMVNVSVDGHGNTVVVNADQRNSGDQRATLVLNGQLDLGR